MPGLMTFSATLRETGRVDMTHPLPVSHKVLRGMMLDVTEQRRLENDLAQAQKLESVGRLAAGVAHEVGNPLNSILAVTQALQRRLGDSTSAEDLKLISNEVARASRTLQQMTRLARPARKAMARLNLNDVAQTTVELMRFDRRARGHEIVTEFAPDLPATWAHADELSQVFLNL